MGVKFRKKPVVIEAAQFNASLHREVFTLATTETRYEFPVRKDDMGRHLIIDTLEGNLRADSGDWIVQGIKKELYPVKPDIFEATYEAVP